MTIPLVGIDEDRGKYYKCWHCGFTCDIERDEFTKALVTSGMGSVVAETPNQHAPDSAVPETYYLIPDTLIHSFTLMEIDAAGDEKGFDIIREVDMTGCPLCGTKAWRD